MNTNKKKETGAERSARWRKNNADKSRKYQREWMREWRKKNPEKVKAQNASEANKKRQARYRKKNKEAILKRQIAYQERKMKNDPVFRLKNTLRQRVITAVKAQSTSKAAKTEKLIGCTVKEYREHLEKQFKDGMTWENHGDIWEIDHIVCLAEFDLTDPEQQKQAFHYTNTQPLDKVANRKKQPKRKLKI